MAEGFSLEKKFSSPEEEVAFLREKFLAREQSGESAPKENMLKEYSAEQTEKILRPDYVLPEEKSEQIVLKLKPEAHDKKMEELLGVLMEHGIKNALNV